MYSYMGAMKAIYWHNMSRHLIQSENLVNFYVEILWKLCKILVSLCLTQGVINRSPPPKKKKNLCSTALFIFSHIVL